MSSQLLSEPDPATDIAKVPKPRYRLDVIGGYTGPFSADSVALGRHLAGECESLEPGETIHVIVTRQDMTDEEYEALPEWAGP